MQGDEEINVFSDKVKNIKTLSSMSSSNGATYGKALLSKNNVECEGCFLEIGNGMPIQFIDWDEEVDLKLVRKIAISFTTDSPD